MFNRKSKIRKPKATPQFTPKTDKPLRYFSVNDVFVRRTNLGGYKLFTNTHLLMLLTYDGFLYKYPSCSLYNPDYLEAFLLDYAPHVDPETILKQLSFERPLHIGKPETVAL